MESIIGSIITGEIANEVIAGKWGNGADRLTKTDYDYKTI